MFSWEFISILGFNIPTFSILFVLIWVSWEMLMRQIGFRHTIRNLPHEWLLLSGLIISRLVFVAMNYKQYMMNPIDIIKISDGGFYLSAGLALTLLFIVIKYREKNRILLLSLWLLIFILWSGLTLFKNDKRSVEPLITTALTEVNINSANRNETQIDTNLLAILSAAKQAQKPVVINIWASWCPPCRREMPMLAETQINREDIEIIFVNQQESLATVKSFLIEQQLELNNLYLDEFGALMQNANILALPTTIFIDHQGFWVESHTGELTSASLNAQIETLIKR